MRRVLSNFATLAATLLACASPLVARGDASSETPNDPVAKLIHSIDAGKATLKADDAQGYLASLLDALRISPTSQVLVFSKASLQANRISPERPRALYFNDETYVGFVQGGIIEIATTDPETGPAFYTLNNAAFARDDRAGKPPAIRFQGNSCVACHAEQSGEPPYKLLFRSVYSGVSGHALFQFGTNVTTQESPLAERWGGWYMTGDVGDQQTLANTRFEDAGDRDLRRLDTDRDHLADLTSVIDTAPYLTAHSDAVALLVLAHQTEMHNRIANAADGVRLAVRDEKIINDALKEHPPAGEHSESTQRRIASRCEPLIKYLFFSNEAALSSPVKGSTDYAAQFQTAGPRDSKGRSLRDFDLKTRLLKYPCSYLIYSESFDALPDAARARVYRRMCEVLRGEDATKPFAHLTPADRTAIAEILCDTKPPFRAAWNAAAPQRGAGGGGSSNDEVRMTNEIRMSE